MDQWATARSRAFDVFESLRSLRARAALDGVSRVQSGSVEIAAGTRRHAIESAPSSAPSLGRRSCLGARFGLLSGKISLYAGLNSVPCRSVACMMIVRRRARAMRVLRIVERFAMARAQALGFRGCLQRVSIRPRGRHPERLHPLNPRRVPQLHRFRRLRYPLGRCYLNGPGSRYPTSQGWRATSPRSDVARRLQGSCAEAPQTVPWPSGDRLRSTAPTHPTAHLTAYVFPLENEKTPDSKICPGDDRP